MEKHNNFLGQRVALSSFIGTVKYVGTVAATTGIWLGVEWDDPSRGKHNGMKDGIQYFKCSSENGGSFVRPCRIHTGISICKALSDRYLNRFDEIVAIVVNHCDDKEDTHSIENLDITECGEEPDEMKILEEKDLKNLANLSLVGLHMQNISSVTSDSVVLANAKNITDLDLSKNLLDDWKTVGMITSQLKRLRILNLSENIMKLPEDPHLLSCNFAHLNLIVLNFCRLNWSDVLSCLPMWPNICELHLAKNNITKITPLPNGVFPELKFFDLSGNCLDEWEDVLSLAKIPCLEELVLNECSLSDIHLNKGDFKALEKLHLSYNEYSSFDICKEIEKLQSIKCLTLRDNPIFTRHDPELTRGVLIVELEKLTKLNKTDITAQERHEAEMDYKKNCRRLKRHASGEVPCKIIPEEEKGPDFEHDLLHVRFTFPTRPDLKPFRKKIGASLTVKEIKQLILAKTGILLKEQDLSYISHRNKRLIVRMEKDNETLHHLSLESKDTIEVVTKVAEA